MIWLEGEGQGRRPSREGVFRQQFSLVYYKTLLFCVNYSTGVFDPLPTPSNDWIKIFLSLLWIKLYQSSNSFWIGTFLFFYMKTVYYNDLESCRLIVKHRKCCKLHSCLYTATLHTFASKMPLSKFMSSSICCKKNKLLIAEPLFICLGIQAMIDFVI